MILSEAIAALLIATRADGRAEATVESYRRKLKPLLAFLDDVPVESITLQDLRRYVTHLMDVETRWADHPKHDPDPGRLSPFTIWSYITHAKRLFSWLTEEGLIGRNPARRLKRPAPRRDAPKAIHQTDLVLLLNSTAGGRPADLRDRAIILMLADTGCRVGGLCGLCLDDLQLDGRLARVREKGGKTRFVPFTPFTGRALWAWLQMRPHNRGPWLFVSLGPKSRGRLTTNGVAQMLKRRGKLAGTTGPVNPHAFRHYFARTYLIKGGDLASLSMLMGHASVEVTASYYAIFLVRELQEKHARFSPIATMEEELEDVRPDDS